jgi:hypothetical protein
MLTIDSNKLYASRNEAELAWKAEQDKVMAAKALGQARRRAWTGRLRRLLSNEIGERRSPVAARQGDFRIEMGEIVGLCEDSLGRGLPPIPKTALVAWTKAYLRFAEEGQGAPFALALRDSSWYLTGGMSELIRFEVARSMGGREVLVRMKDSDRQPRLVETVATIPSECLADRRAG